MPAFDSIHTLSVSQEAISSLAFNARGDWLALGSAALGQLLVWEWRSETYILKQQGHFYDIATLAYSPDGAYIATGADDAKVGFPAHDLDPAFGRGSVAFAFAMKIRALPLKPGETVDVIACPGMKDLLP